MKVTPGVVTYATNIGRNASRAHYLSKSPFDDLAATKGSVATFRRRQIIACPAPVFRLPNRRDGR
jgi:hypothetical protein